MLLTGNSPDSQGSEKKPPMLLMEDAVPVPTQEPSQPEPNMDASKAFVDALRAQSLLKKDDLLFEKRAQPQDFFHREELAPRYVRYSNGFH
jgi:hypothetical protein